MTSTRLRHPLHNLTHTAHDLALYLQHVSVSEFLTLLTEVRQKYAEPKQSWLWFMFYTRGRLSQLDATILDLDKNHPSISEVIVTILKEGGWEETSANTGILRALLSKLPGYDHETTLELNELIELKGLLFNALEKRLEMVNHITQEEKKLNEIEEARQRVERELLKKQEALLRKQEELTEKEQILLSVTKKESSKEKELERIHQECKDKLADLNLLEHQLTLIETEKNRKEKELEEARRTLLLLNPEIDIKKMTVNEIETVMKEAKQVGEIAVKTYLKERNEILRKREELASMQGQVGQAKERLAGMEIGGVRVDQAETALQKQHEEEVRLRKQEVQEACQSRNKKNDGAVKSYLERFLKVQLNDRSKEKIEEGELVKRKVRLNDMTIQGPRSTNPHFLKMFEQVEKQFKPRAQAKVDVVEIDATPAVQEAPTQTGKISKTRRLQLQQQLFGATSVANRNNNNTESKEVQAHKM